MGKIRSRLERALRKRLREGNSIRVRVNLMFRGTDLFGNPIEIPTAAEGLIAGWEVSGPRILRAEFFGYGAVTLAITDFKSRKVDWMRDEPAIVECVGAS